MNLLIKFSCSFSQEILPNALILIAINKTTNKLINCQSQNDPVMVVQFYKSLLVTNKKQCTTMVINNFSNIENVRIGISPGDNPINVRLPIIAVKLTQFVT
jgi:hypothetical protein